MLAKIIDRPKIKAKNNKEDYKVSKSEKFRRNCQVNIKIGEENLFSFLNSHFTCQRVFTIPV